MNTNSEQFCDSYSKNEFQIDSILSHDFKRYYLVIDSNYWRIDGSEDTNVTFDSDDSKSNEMFEKRFNITFTAFDGNAPKLVSYDANETEMRVFEFNETQDDFQLKENFTDNSISSFNPLLCFRVKDDEAIGCVERNHSHRIFQFWRIGIIGQSLIFTKLDENNLTQSPILERLQSMNESLEVIGIFMTETNDSLVLIQSDAQIQYCFIGQGCNQNNFKTLIECQTELNATTSSPNSSPTSTPASSPNSSSTSSPTSTTTRGPDSDCPEFRPTSVIMIAVLVVVFVSVSALWIRIKWIHFQEMNEPTSVTKSGDFPTATSSKDSDYDSTTKSKSNASSSSGLAVRTDSSTFKSKVKSRIR